MGEGFGHMLGVLLLTAPWLFSMSYGPTPAVTQMVFAALCAALFATACVVASGSERSLTRSVTVAWAVAASLSAAMGLLQYLGYAHAWDALVDFAAPGQAYGNLRQRNQFATLMAIGLVCAVWVAQRAMATPLARPLRHVHVALWIAVVFLLALACAASGSRTGLLQVLLLALLAWAWRVPAGLWLWALLAYGAGAWLLPLALGGDLTQSGILARLQETSAPCSSRLTLWSNVLHLIGLKPWLGWGWGELAYAHWMTLYDGPRFCEIMGNAHNLPLHLAVTLGIPVAAVICAALVWLIWRGKPWAERDATRQMAWGVLAMMGLHSLLEYPLWYGPFQLAALLSVWMLWSTRQAEGAALRTPEGARQGHWQWKQWRQWKWAAIAFALAACGYTGWDYWRISQIYLPVAQRAAGYQANTLDKVRSSVLFQDQVLFAELGTTPLTPQNARHIHALALRMLHFSPEAMVVEKVIDSARLLGDDATALYYTARYQAAYPDAYAAWSNKAN